MWGWFAPRSIQAWEGQTTPTRTHQEAVRLHAIVQQAAFNQCSPTAMHRCSEFLPATQPLRHRSFCDRRQGRSYEVQTLRASARGCRYRIPPSLGCCGGKKPQLVKFSSPPDSPSPGSKEQHNFCLRKKKEGSPPTSEECAPPPAQRSKSKSLPCRGKKTQQAPQSKINPNTSCYPGQSLEENQRDWLDFIPKDRLRDVKKLPLKKKRTQNSEQSNGGHGS